MDRPRASTGFTVIELLVVMGVIAVLASILFPVVGAAIHNSRAALCAANERQLLGAMTSYASDNSGYLPNPGQAWVMDGVGVADFNIGVIWQYISPSVQTRAARLRIRSLAPPSLAVSVRTPTVLPRAALTVMRQRPAPR